MKLFYYLVILFVIYSCGGTKYVDNIMIGDYVSVDARKMELTYGIKVHGKNSFTLWYLDTNCKITETNYILDDLEIINNFKYFYYTDQFPTWIYEYSSSKSNFNIAFYEFKDGTITPYIFWKEYPEVYIDPGAQVRVKVKGVDSIEDVFHYSKLKKRDATWAFPEVYNLKDTKLYNNLKNRSLNYIDIDKKILKFNGVVIDQFYEKSELFYNGTSEYVTLRGEGKYKWEEINVVKVENEEQKVYASIITSVIRSNDEPKTYSYLLDNINSFQGRVKSYKYIDSDKTEILLNIKNWNQ